MKQKRKLFDVDLEHAVLGGILLRPAILRTVPLDWDDFGDPRAKLVWEAMATLDENREPIDVLTIEDTLTQMGKIDAVGLPFLAELELRVPSPENVLDYARRIKQYTVTRKVYSLCAEAMAAYNEGRVESGHGDELLDQLLQGVNAIRAAKPIGGITMGDAMRLERDKILADMRKIEDGKKVWVGVPIGFRDFDLKLGGAPRGVLSTFAAEQSDGKTTFLDNSMDNVEDAGFEGILCTWEDNTQSFAQRGLGRQTAVDTEIIRSRNFGVGNAGRFMERAPWAFRRNRKLFNCAGRDAKEVVRLARLHKLERGRLDIVGIDYIQKLGRPKGRNMTEYDGINYNIAILNALAQEEDIAVMVMSQLTLDHVKRTRENKMARPGVADLRGSGNIGNESKVVAFLWWPAKHLTRVQMVQEGFPDHRYELNVEKNHNGTPQFNVVLWVDAPTSMIANDEVDALNRRARRDS